MASIISDLQKKMAFLSGPRQAGKTTLAKQIASKFKSSVYLNFDNYEDRRIIKNAAWPQQTELVIFDEIHKMANWKNYLKGIFDTKPAAQKMLVTGSARLEIFNQVGDSLAGRYFLHRLLPLSMAELRKMNGDADLERFIARGSFPEPYLARTDIDAKRWRLQYVDSLLQTDILDFDSINNIKAIRLVFELLRNRVGSPISYTAIAEDVAISPNTVKKYIVILEALYIVFRVFPFTKNIARSLHKEPKIYFFDTGLVQGDKGLQLENLVAVSLLKHVFGKIDYLAENYTLNYLRTREHKEVDFVLACDNNLEKMIEVKYAEHNISTNLRYFHNKYQIPAVQVVKEIRQCYSSKGIEVTRADEFLRELYL